MKTGFSRIIKPAAGAAIVLALVWGCNDDDKTSQLSPEQKQANATQAAQDNNQMIATTQEVMDVTAGAFAEKGITSGRTLSEGRASSWGCAPSVEGTFKVDTTIPDSLIYSGSITLDYGTGESCPDSLHRRTGRITDTFVYSVSLKNKFAFSSSETISFEGFKKDTVLLDGAIVITSASKEPTTVEAQGTKITYGDGTASVWNGSLTFEYEKINKCRDWGGSTITVTGALTGTTRSDTDFSASISKGVEFRNNCFKNHQFVPVAGTVNITSDGASSVLDYGDGKCDKKYTITVDGTTTEYKWDKSDDK